MPCGWRPSCWSVQGGTTGGWSLYAHEGLHLTYCYNFVGARYFYTRADTPLPAGTHQVRMEFAYDGGGIGRGGTITLYVDGDQAAEGRVERTHLFIFSMDETTEVGNDAGAPVSEDYGPTGTPSPARSLGSSSTSPPPPTPTT